MPCRLLTRHAEPLLYRRFDMQPSRTGIPDWPALTGILGSWVRSPPRMYILCNGTVYRTPRLGRQPRVVGNNRTIEAKVWWCMASQRRKRKTATFLAMGDFVRELTNWSCIMRLIGLDKAIPEPRMPVRPHCDKRVVRVFRPSFDIGQKASSCIAFHSLEI